MQRLGLKAPGDEELEFFLAAGSPPYPCRPRLA